MKNLAMIACVSKDWGIGYDGDLIWHIPEDMKFFRTTTSGSLVAMGRKTFESIGRALPKRQNVVLSRHPLAVSEVDWCTNKPELDLYLHQYSGQKFIIGGASLYQMYLDEAETIYLTEVHAEKPASEFFPQFDKSKYSRQVLQTGDYGETNYEIVKYIKN